MNEATQAAVAASALSVILSYLNMRWANLRLAIVLRWCVRVSFSALLAAAVIEYGWTTRPLWVIAVMIFLAWFLLETMLNWWAISERSRDAIPLFPRFRENATGDDWPANKYTILLREWLRSRGFRKLASAKAPLTDELFLRSSFYEDDRKRTRLQILFFPYRVGKPFVCFVFTTRTQEGELVVTDNQYSPFGGFYPENYFVDRRPLTRSIESLLKLHERRIEEGHINVEPWDDEDPVDQCNAQMRELERVNLEAGYLIHPQYHDEYGRITWEGRYRIWKELLLLNYFGRTVEN